MPERHVLEGPRMVPSSQSPEDREGVHRHADDCVEQFVAVCLRDMCYMHAPSSQSPEDRQDVHRHVDDYSVKF